jgi:hypothetical protein
MIPPYLFILVGIPLVIALYFLITYLISLWIPPQPGKNVPYKIASIAENQPSSLSNLQCYTAGHTMPSAPGISFFLYLNQINPGTFTGMNRILNLGSASENTTTNPCEPLEHPIMSVSIANNSSSLMVSLTPLSLNPSESLEFEIDNTIPLRKPVHYFLQCMPSTSGNTMMFNVFRNGEFIKSKTIPNSLTRIGSGALMLQTGQVFVGNSTYSASIQRLYLFSTANQLSLKDIQSLSLDPVSF